MATWDAGFVTEDPHDLPSDDDLVAAADRVFAELDHREQPE